MKITKELVKQIIQEEIDKQLEEQMTDAELDAAEKAAMAKGFEPITDKPTKIVGKAPKTETKLMQAMLNLSLKALNSDLEPLVIDGKVGKKTRGAAKEIRKNLKRGESIMTGMERLTGMDRKGLKRTAARIVIDADPEAQTAFAMLDKATAPMTATPAGPMRESFERFLK